MLHHDVKRKRILMYAILMISLPTALKLYELQTSNGERAVFGRTDNKSSG